MTEQIYSNNARKINQNKKILESALKIKIKTKENIVYLEGKAENEFLALKVIEAINLGFTINKAIMITEEGFVFEKIFIKNIAKRKDMSQIRARVIGTKRKALNTIESLTDCFICLHNNYIGVIGSLENVKKALYALKRIVAGSKHSAMYAWLEAQKAKEIW